jgi:hypothetical protein
MVSSSVLCIALAADAADGPREKLDRLLGCEFVRIKVGNSVARDMNIVMAALLATS